MRVLLLVLGFVLWGGVSAQLSLVLLPESKVTYTATRPGETWSGQAPLASGSIILEPENIRASDLSLELAPEAFSSGNLIRDLNARRTVFETATYPVIRFEAERIATDSNRLTLGSPQTVTLEGTLTLHGVTQNVELEVIALWDGARLEARGGFALSLSAHAIRRPSIFNVTVDDTVRIDFSIYASVP